MNRSEKTIFVQGLLDRLNQGDMSAKEELIEQSAQRLRALTAKMLGGFAKVRRWEETNDVLQNSIIRLHRSLDDIQPATVRDYFGLAALQIRRELLDLKRHYYGPMGEGHNHATIVRSSEGSTLRVDPIDANPGPVTQAQYAEFHDLVDRLSDDEQEVINMYYYQGLPQEEIAELLGVSIRTVKRRVRSAKLRLHSFIKPGSPGEGL